MVVKVLDVCQKYTLWWCSFAIITCTEVLRNLKSVLWKEKSYALIL